MTLNKMKAAKIVLFFELYVRYLELVSQDVVHDLVNECVQVLFLELHLGFPDESEQLMGDIAAPKNELLDRVQVGHQLLRLGGLLEYDAELLDRINRGELIPAGSEEEIEMRACTVHAVARIADHLRSSGSAVSERDLDVYLWTYGQRPEIKAQPRHRTRSTFY